MKSLLLILFTLLLSNIAFGNISFSETCENFNGQLSDELEIDIQSCKIPHSKTELTSIKVDGFGGKSNKAKNDNRSVSAFVLQAFLSSCQKLKMSTEIDDDFDSTVDLYSNGYDISFRTTTSLVFRCPE